MHTKKCHWVFQCSICISISPLKFTGNEDSKSGPLHLVFVLVLCTLQKGSCFQSSVYVSVIEIFVAFFGLSSSSSDTIFARSYGVLRGPCFCCGFSCQLFSSCFTWCFVFTSSYILTHESHTSSRTGLHICQGCQ